MSKERNKLLNMIHHARKKEAQLTRKHSSLYLLLFLFFWNFSCHVHFTSHTLPFPFFLLFSYLVPLIRLVGRKKNLNPYLLTQSSTSKQFAKYNNLSWKSLFYFLIVILQFGFDLFMKIISLKYLSKDEK